MSIFVSTPKEGIYICICIYAYICICICTFKHILNICPTFLMQRRFDFRQDSVLATISRTLQTTKTREGPAIYADLDKFRIGGRTIPPSIRPTILQPVLIVVDKESKIVWIHELSVAFEDNFKTGHGYKLNKYRELKDDIIQNGWKCHLEPISVGSRWLVPFFTKQILRTLFKNLGSNFWMRKLIKMVSKTVLIGSHIIWLARNDPNRRPPDLISY